MFDNRQLVEEAGLDAGKRLNKALAVSLDSDGGHEERSASVTGPWRESKGSES